jgi:hypothetical protein
MVTKLEPGASPVRVRLRRYSAPQAVFLRNYTDRLVAIGHAFRNPTSTWCCAPLLVTKLPDTFRFTVDLRTVNKFTVPQMWPMPHLESELARVSRATFFSTFDFSNGYWQLPVDLDSADVHSFITLDGVFTAD